MGEPNDADQVTWTPPDLCPQGSETHQPLHRKAQGPGPGYSGFAEPPTLRACGPGAIAQVDKNLGQVTSAPPKPPPWELMDPAPTMQMFPRTQDR